MAVIVFTGFKFEDFPFELFGYLPKFSQQYCLAYSPQACNDHRLIRSPTVQSTKEHTEVLQQFISPNDDFRGRTGVRRVRVVHGIREVILQALGSFIRFG